MKLMLAILVFPLELLLWGLLGLVLLVSFSMIQILALGGMKE